MGTSTRLQTTQARALQKARYIVLHSVATEMQSSNAPLGAIYTGSRSSIPGMAIKEPDDMWVSGSAVPEAQHCSFCALAVARRNQGIAGLFFETKLWAQNGDSDRPVVKPSNFVGILASEEANHIAVFSLLHIQAFTIALSLKPSVLSVALDENDGPT